MTVAAQFGRWRWWYDAIIDLLLANPDLTQGEIAKRLGKAPSTISLIMTSDTFKSHFASRRQAFSEAHDFATVSKLQKVADLALDGVIKTLETRRDKIPLGQLNTIQEKALERLGYGVQAPAKGGVTVNVNQPTNVVQVSPEVLAGARQTLRQVEQKRIEDKRSEVIDLEPEVSPGDGREEVEPSKASGGAA